MYGHFYSFVSINSLIFREEEGILGYIQVRKGPNVVGLYGVSQPLMDGIGIYSRDRM